MGRSTGVVWFPVGCYIALIPVKGSVLWDLHVVSATKTILPRPSFFQILQRSFHRRRICYFLTLSLGFFAHDPEDGGRAEKVGSEPFEINGTFLGVGFSH